MASTPRRESFFFFFLPSVTMTIIMYLGGHRFKIRLDSSFRRDQSVFIVSEARLERFEIILIKECAME